MENLNFLTKKNDSIPPPNFSSSESENPIPLKKSVRPFSVTLVETPTTLI
jgi:hypothetical protein